MPGAAGSTERLRLVDAGSLVTGVPPVTGDEDAFGKAGIGCSDEAAGSVAVETEPAAVTPLTAP